jgi:hypothetical protein
MGLCIGNCESGLNTRDRWPPGRTRSRGVRPVVRTDAEVPALPPHPRCRLAGQHESPQVRGLSVVGREGFEPSTLGLRVRADRTQLGARNANYLQAPTFTDPPNTARSTPSRQACTRIRTRSKRGSPPLVVDPDSRVAQMAQERRKVGATIRRRETEAQLPPTRLRESADASLKPSTPRRRPRS